MSLLDEDAVLKTDLLQCKHVIKVGEESLYEEISLPVTPASV